MTYLSDLVDEEGECSAEIFRATRVAFIQNIYESIEEIDLREDMPSDRIMNFIGWTGTLLEVIRHAEISAL